jgi:hypothetical protein
MADHAAALRKAKGQVQAVLDLSVSSTLFNSARVNGNNADSTTWKLPPITMALTGGS